MEQSDSASAPRLTAQALVAGVSPLGWEDFCPSSPSGHGQIPIPIPEVFCSPAALKWEAGKTKVCTLV